MNDATRIDKTHDTRTVEKKTSAEITDMFNELLGMNGRSHTYTSIRDGILGEFILQQQQVYTPRINTGTNVHFR